MEKKLQRVFRDRPLTPEEVASDREVRKRIAAEFLPSRAPFRPQSSSLSDLLKKSIRESGKSVEEIAGDAGVSPVLIAGFLSGERDIHVTTADKLVSALGFEVTVE
jgi:transcriptional regulator with XRE-family HTH domain